MENENKGKNIVLMVIAIAAMFLIIIFSEPIGGLIFGDLNNSTNPALSTFFMYISGTLPMCVIVILLCLIVKPYRSLLRLFGGKSGSNCAKWILLGIVFGAGANMVVAVFAMLSGSIQLTFNRFEIQWVLLLFLGVLIQSASEELLCRMLVMQMIRKVFPQFPIIAILGNAVIFSLLHILNPGTSALALLVLMLIGVLYSLIVYYSHSIWGAIIAHTTWNFTQSIVLGLPNSGKVVPYYIWGLSGDTVSGMAYDQTFGLESSWISLLVLAICCTIVILIGKKETLANCRKTFQNV